MLTNFHKALNIKKKDILQKPRQKLMYCNENDSSLNACKDVVYK
jgi:hypothetical protein